MTSPSTPATFEPPPSRAAARTDAAGTATAASLVTNAIASCANYLVHNGWKSGLSLNERRRVLWSYNHSPAYIDTVLALASRLDTGGATKAPSAPSRANPTVTAKKKPQRSTRPHQAVRSANNPPGDGKARTVAQN